MPSECCYFVDKAAAADAAPALYYFGSILHCFAVFTQNLGQTLNYKEDTKTINFDDVKNEVSEEASGSDLDCCGAPNKHDSFDTRVSETIVLFLFAKAPVTQGFSAQLPFELVSL